MDKLPLTSSGKINKNVLPEPNNEIRLLGGCVDIIGYCLLGKIFQQKTIK